MNYPADKKIRRIDIGQLCDNCLGGLFKVEFADIDWIDEDRYKRIINREGNFQQALNFPIEIDRFWLPIPFKFETIGWEERSTEDDFGCLYDQVLVGRIKFDQRARVELHKMKQRKMLLKITTTERRSQQTDGDRDKWCYLVGDLCEPVQMTWRTLTNTQRASDKRIEVRFVGRTSQPAPTYHPRF